MLKHRNLNICYQICCDCLWFPSYVYNYYRVAYSCSI